MNTIEFFDTIFGDAVGPGRLLSIFTIPGKKSQCFDAIEKAASYATSLGPGVHVYHRMGLMAERPDGRGKADDTCAITALWCDVDVAGGAHAGDALPPTKDHALQFLLKLAIPPSVIVDSGNGLHGYWPLEGPVVDWEQAKQLAKGWHQIVCDQAKKCGWSLENLGDLARVLRVPGTWNPKTSPPQQAVVIHATGEIFSADRFRVDLQPEPPATVPFVPHVTPGRLTPLDRCRLYLDTMPPAIQGQGGGTSTLLACKAIFRFGLAGAEARAAFDHYNQRAVPQWTSEKQIQHKLQDAEKSVAAEGGHGKFVKDDPPPYDQIAEAAAEAFLSQGNGNAAVAGNLDSVPEDPCEFPIDCIRAPGLISDIIDYNLRTAMYPQPELALAAALALMAVITGRKVCDSFGTRTNIYILGLAPSGAGKEHARKVNKSILIESGGEKMIGPERIASSAGLVATVADNPAVLFQIDEIGKLLATMRNPMKQPHLYNIGTVLLQLYSSSDSLWIADAYADVKKTKRINQPHACVYGTSVPGAFWDNLTSENVSEGLLGRLLAFEARMVPIRKPTKEPVPPAIVESVRWWLEFRPSQAGGNLTTENPVPHLVSYSPAAQERIDRHLSDICDRRTKESEIPAAVWSRSGEKAAKLALLFACSKATSSTLPRVELEDIDRAVKIANWLTRKMLRKAFEHVAENETESRSKKLLRLISSELTMTELTRKTQWLRQKERLEIIANLQSAGYLEVSSKETNGRPTTYLKRLA